MSEDLTAEDLRQRSEETEWQNLGEYIRTTCGPHAVNVAKRSPVPNPCAHAAGAGGFACRKCPSCLRLRSWNWQRRAENEFRSHSVCWWLTLSLRRSTDQYDQVQKWLKRMRKAGKELRYMIVEEHGEKRGRRHWHCLIFSNDLTRRSLWGWKRGQVRKAKLLSNLPPVQRSKVFRYVAKYATKTAENGRRAIRASIGFGNRVFAIHRVGGALAEYHAQTVHCLVKGVDRGFDVFGLYKARPKAIFGSRLTIRWDWWNASLTLHDPCGADKAS